MEKIKNLSDNAIKLLVSIRWAKGKELVYQTSYRGGCAWMVYRKERVFTLPGYGDFFLSKPVDDGKGCVVTDVATGLSVRYCKSRKKALIEMVSFLDDRGIVPSNMDEARQKFWKREDVASWKR